MIRPSDFAAPAAGVIGQPTDADPIEAGILIVGAGPAGLAAAIRLGQLARDDPATEAGLGDVPVAVLEKGRAPGSHLLSGAVMDPGPLRRLLGETPFPVFGEVPGEAVYLLTRARAWRIPTPPTMRNEGNVIVSLSSVGRALAAEAERLGVTVLPETPGQRLLVEDDAVVGVRTGDRGRGRDGEELSRFEAGADIRARVTILAEGTQGHLTGAAVEHFQLAGRNPQVWALGVKEVWKVPRPLRRVIHTLGWPLRAGARFREFGGSFVYPLGDDMVSLGMVVGLDHADIELSVHDLLQELKGHLLVRGILEGGERIAWGAKTIPEGGFLSLPRALHAPGLLLCGDGAGFVNVPALKGIHYAVESGRLAAEAAWTSLADGKLGEYDASLRESFIWKELQEVRNMRQAFGHGLWAGSAVAGLMTATKGRFPRGDRPVERDSEQPVEALGAAAGYPVTDGRVTFDRLSSVFLSGNRTRDDQPNHISVQTRVPRALAELWMHMCPAGVYGLGITHGDGTVDVTLSPSNCVQCGAISAKGGRLTPPEGGSGPEYTLT